MPRYIVEKGSYIELKGKGAKAKSKYGPGDVMELTEKEAKAFGASIRPAPAEKVDETKES